MKKKPLTKVAIIGAGISGISLALELHNKADVTIYEKEKVSGGRIATLRLGKYNFNHGAQFIKVRSDNFKSFVKKICDKGVVKAWECKFAEIRNCKITATREWGHHPAHFIGVPYMDTITTELSKGLRVIYETDIKVCDKNSTWQLTDSNGKVHGRFDWIVCTIPDPTKIEIIDHKDNKKNCVSAKIKCNTLPCIALMIGYAGNSDTPFDAAIIKGSDLSWVSIRKSYTRKGELCESIVAHSTNAWAKINIEKDKNFIENHLIESLSQILRLDKKNIEYISHHKWLVANAKKNKDNKTHEKFSESKIIFCGDRYIKGRVEAGFISGYESAHDLLSEID